MSHEKILRLVKRFVVFIEEAIVVSETVRRPREMKKAAREFAQQVLKEKLLPLPLEKRNGHIYESFLPIIWQKATQSGISGLLEACSRTLILKECTKFAKQHKWHPRRR